MELPDSLVPDLMSPLRRAFWWSIAVFVRGGRRVQPFLADLGFFGGLVVVAIGIGLIYLPAGLIAAGAALSGCVYLDQRSKR